MILEGEKHLKLVTQTRTPDIPLGGSMQHRAWSAELDGPRGTPALPLEAGVFGGIDFVESISSPVNCALQQSCAQCELMEGK